MNTIDLKQVSATDDTAMMPDAAGSGLCAISDAAAGNRRQALALAQSLDPDSALCTLHPDWRARWLAPRRFAGAAAALGADFSALLAHPPAMVIGCGRQAALATRLLRRAGSRSVQILDPRVDPSHWDLVIVPEHDRLRGTNVLTLLGSLNPVDAAWLAAARTAHAPLQQLPQPRTAVLLGGSSRHVRFDAASFDRLGAVLDRVLDEQGGSLLVTASRRTEPQVRAQLHHRLGGHGLVWVDACDGPNPYPGLLAWADRIVCSPDSVNMLSEACATAAPVFVFEPEAASGRLRIFLNSLQERGRIRPLDARLAPFACQPLQETRRIAALLRERLG